MKLKKYIKENYGTHVAFAEHLGVKRQQVDTWVRKKYRIIEEKGVLYLFYKGREIPEKED